MFACGPACFSERQWHLHRVLVWMCIYTLCVYVTITWRWIIFASAGGLLFTGNSCCLRGFALCSPSLTSLFLTSPQPPNTGTLPPRMFFSCCIRTCFSDPPFGFSAPLSREGFFCWRFSLLLYFFRRCFPWSIHSRDVSTVENGGKSSKTTVLSIHIGFKPLFLMGKW